MKLEDKLVELATAVGQDIGDLMSLIAANQSKIEKQLNDNDFYFAYRNPDVQVEE